MPDHTKNVLQSYEKLQRCLRKSCSEAVNLNAHYNGAIAHYKALLDNKNGNRKTDIAKVRQSLKTAIADLKKSRVSIEEVKCALAKCGKAYLDHIAGQKMHIIAQLEHIDRGMEILAKFRDSAKK